MRRVPEWLPNIIHCIPRPIRSGAIEAGINMQMTSYVEIPTSMMLVIFQSPALIEGLLMTECQIGSREVQRCFFGYKCVGCEKIYLVDARVRNEFDAQRYAQHQCDPSELRRAVRNARHLALERGEYIMEDYKGEWSVHK